MIALRIGSMAAIVLATVGCATSSARLSVVGRAIEVEPRKGTPARPVEGELLAVDRERVWVRGPMEVRAVPMQEIEEVRVRQHGLTKHKVGLWVALGAAISGAALAIACSSVEDAGDCGRVFLPVIGTWGALGVPSMLALDKTSRLRVKPSDWEALRGYARFPQGLPEGFDDAAAGGKADPSPKR